MRNRAYGAASLIFVIASVIVLLLGVYWLVNGITKANADIVLKGSIALISGAALGAVANFMK